MGEQILIRGGTVITMDPGLGDFRTADVLVDDGAIVAVGPDLEAAEATLLDASEMIVMPGLVDAHNHLWYGALRSLVFDMGWDDLVDVSWVRVGSSITPDDVYSSTRGSIATAIDNGVTSLYDFFHVANSPEHGDAAIRAHLESPLRAVFGYGPSIAKKLQELAGENPADEDWSNAARVQAEIFADDPLRDLALSISGPDTTSIEETGRDLAVAREIGVPIAIHTAYREGDLTGAVTRMANAELLGPDIQFVHCCATSGAELKMIAEAGAKAAWCPTAEVAVGLGIPPTRRARDLGLPVAFGCDAFICASGDMFQEARAGLLLDRVQRATERYAQYRPTETTAELGLSSREALAAVTANGADSIWLGDKVGSLTPGKRADIILLRRNDLNLAPFNTALETLVSCAHGGNVDTVMIDGKLVKQHGELLFCDREEIAADLRTTAERLLVAADCSDQFRPALPGA